MPPKPEEEEALLMLERLSLDGAPADDGSLIPSHFPSKLAEVARDTLVAAFDEEQFKEPLRHQLHGIFRYCAQHITDPEIREDLLSSIRNPRKYVIYLGDHAAQRCPAREFEGFKFKEYLNKVGVYPSAILEVHFLTANTCSGVECFSTTKEWTCSLHWEENHRTKFFTILNAGVIEEVFRNWHLCSMPEEQTIMMLYYTAPGEDS